MSVIKIFTIGFTQTSAEEFFGKLIKAGVKKIIDARLNNSSQLAGFAKRDGFRFFLKALNIIVNIIGLGLLSCHAVLFLL